MSISLGNLYQRSDSNYYCSNNCTTCIKCSYIYLGYPVKFESFLQILFKERFRSPTTSFLANIMRGKLLRDPNIVLLLYLSTKSALEKLIDQK